MKIFSMTDVGRKREMNQDYVFATDESLGTLPNLLVVADGMGGHKAGDFASKYTVEVLKEELKHTLKDGPEEILKDAAQTANHKLIEKADEDINLEGMGTTLVAATVIDHTLYFINVGDSRLYLLREQLEQVTRDHSYVEELVALGKMKRGSHDYIEKKNIITRAVGTGREVDIDLFALKLKSRDYVLMCSDGLSNMVDEFEIEYIIRSEEGIRQKVESLVAAANRNGGRDNISVVLIEPQISEVSL